MTKWTMSTTKKGRWRKKLKPQIAGKKFLPVVAARETTKWSISTLPPSCRWCCLSLSISVRKHGLLQMHTVVLNLEETNKDTSRRIIDFLSGVAYANGGKIKRVSTCTYIITPYNVDLTGDEVMDELENNGVYV